MLNYKVLQIPTSYSINFYKFLAEKYRVSMKSGTSLLLEWNEKEYFRDNRYRRIILECMTFSLQHLNVTVWILIWNWLLTYGIESWCWVTTIFWRQLSFVDDKDGRDVYFKHLPARRIISPWNPHLVKPFASSRTILARQSPQPQYAPQERHWLDVTFPEKSISEKGVFVGVATHLSLSPVKLYIQWKSEISVVFGNASKIQTWLVSSASRNGFFNIFWPLFVWRIHFWGWNTIKVDSDIPGW